jgi:hypothetical protein
MRRAFFPPFPELANSAGKSVQYISYTMNLVLLYEEFVSVLSILAVFHHGTGVTLKMADLEWSYARRVLLVRY